MFWWCTFTQDEPEWVAGVPHCHSKMSAGCLQSLAAPFPQPLLRSASTLWREETTLVRYDTLISNRLLASCIVDAHRVWPTKDSTSISSVSLPASERRGHKPLGENQKWALKRKLIFCTTLLGDRNTISAQTPIFHYSIYYILPC